MSLGTSMSRGTGGNLQIGTGAVAIPSSRVAVSMLLLYVALLPIQVQLEITGGRLLVTGPSDAVLLLLLAVSGPELRLQREAWTKWHLGLLLLLPASALGVSLTGGSIEASVYASKAVGLLSLFALYAVITGFVHSWQDIARILRAFCVSVVLANAAATVWFLGRQLFGLFGGVEDPRLRGFLPDPNAYGGLLLVALAIHLATSTSADPLLRGPIRWLADLTLPVSIILTNSRSAWAALVGLMLMLIFVRPRAVPRLAFPFVLGLGAMVATTASGLWAQQVALAFRPSGRFDILRAAWEAFEASPLVGIGLGEFVRLHGVIVHNTGAWFLAEFGLIGFGILLMFLATIGRWAIVTYRRAVGSRRDVAMALGLGFAVMLALSGGIEALYQRWWWLIIALIGCCRGLDGDVGLESWSDTEESSSESPRLAMPGTKTT